MRIRNTAATYSFWSLNCFPIKRPLTSVVERTLFVWTSATTPVLNNVSATIFNAKWNTFSSSKIVDGPANFFYCHILFLKYEIPVSDLKPESKLYGCSGS
jgi:hypothetical protein